jgi:GST-like protein
MTDRLELWTAPTPNGWKVSIMIEELRSQGADLSRLRVKTVDLAGKEQYSPEFTALNPNQKIPVLLDGPHAIMESCAILQYLAEKHPGPLLPAGEARWNILPWVYWQAANVGPAFGNRQSYVRYMPDVPEAEKRHPQERFLKEARRLSAMLERQLDGRPYVCGDSYTIADIALYPWFRGWKWSKVDMTDRPNILGWLARIRARPQVAAGLAYDAAEGEVDRWSADTRERYARGGTTIAT